MNNLSTFNSTSKTMSSREIAQLCEKRHDHVKRDIENMGERLNLDIPKFGGIYLDTKNRKQTEYLLNEELTMTLITGYNVVLRNRVIKRWKELEEQIVQPRELSRLEILQLALEAEQQNLALQQQVKALEPKAKGLDRIADSTNLLGIREASKVLNLGQKELTQYLIDHKVIYRDESGKLQAYQRSTNQKLVKTITSAPRMTSSGERAFTQVKLTQKLVARIAKWLEGGEGCAA